MKYCKKCETNKPKEEYWKNRTSKDGLQAWCKPCWYAGVKSKLEGESREKYLRMRKNGNLKRTHGITLEEYEVKESEQNYSCAICGWGDKLDITTDGEPLPQPILGGTSAISREQSTDT